MAKLANFKTDSFSFSASINKLDRKKVYGWTEVKTYDQDGNECSLAGITKDGRYLLPSGSVALGLFLEDGKYITRKELEAVDEEGKKLEKVPSVFDEAVELREDVSIEDYMDMNVKSIYQLDIEDGADKILEELKSGKIFHMIFNYRADYEGDDAYLILNEDTVFMVVGKKTEFEYLGLETAVTETAPEEEIDESDSFDFGML
ncbi:MAG: hypothetical protein GY714_03950 [Desulfobacterales bacterium]|nr:hypothetical protein [Desulfobacterales bacterium]MCP4162140.1 hypothetical protein [Deltaproteobacteria bacterium]